MQSYTPFAGQMGASMAGTMPTLGNRQAVQQQEQISLAQLLESYKQAQERGQLGQQMQNSEFVQGSGALGALAQMAQAYMGGKIRRKSGETAVELAERITRAQTEAEQTKAMQAQQAKIAEQQQLMDARRKAYGNEQEMFALTGDVTKPTRGVPMMTDQGLVIVDPTTNQYQMATPQGQPQARPQQSPQMRDPAKPLDPVADFGDLSARYGAQVTSLRRDPAKNAAVGGTKGSFHLSGEGGDFVVPQAKKQAFMADAKARGYQAIDEGDHIHLEPPGRGMTVTQFGQGQQIGQSPNAPLRPYEKPKAQSVTLTPSEVAALGLPAGTLAQRNSETGDIEIKNKPSAKPTAQQSSQAKIPQLNNVTRGLDRIDKALAGLDGMFVDTGPLDQLLVSKTKAGQELDSAVGGIQNSMLALTRVPGVGSQSDLEAKIAALQYPSLEKHPDVNRRDLENLRAFMKDLESSFGVKPAAPANDDDALINKYLNL